MMQHLKVQYFTYGILNVLDTRITKFEDLIALRANKMIVLLKSIRLFILREIFAKLMFGNQIALH
ncbi:hypothetical protein A3SI_12654 [Nitritalea halalkaliphila LW7]|uniref:Uncharacterized protein n=1 Tax=Nitritalea halalkaliphila LW7 TaxID=1189621 RepID=I5C1J6_9BACT|nr:hypothetical protein A3SI_12654 [Nitritalea halalkaliphila LW7]